MVQMSGSGGVVVLTPMNLEYKAVRAQLGELRRAVHPSGMRAEVGTVPGVPWPVAVVLAGEGNAQAAALAERAAAWFRPRALFVVGVAGGLRDEIELGDVVVATWVYGYHGGKEDTGGFRPRPRSWPGGFALVQAAQMTEARAEWARSLPVRPAVHFKPVAAGEVVLNSRVSPLARRLSQHFDDAAAIEMESAGAASAAHLNGALPVLTIRGISDKADGRKHMSDAAGLQPRAAKHAAVFTMAVLRELAEASSAADDEDRGDAPGPGKHGLGWRPLGLPLAALWPPDLGVARARGLAAVELCIPPTRPGTPLEARRLAALSGELAALGRATGLFEPAHDVAERVSPAAAATAGGAGLAVARGGERCGWLPLPADTLGAVLDPEDLPARLAACSACSPASTFPPRRRPAWPSP